MAIGLPIAAMQGRMGWVQAGAKAPVIPSNFGVAAAVVMSVIIGAGIALSALRWRGALVGTTVAVMLVTGALFQYGFAMTDAGQNEMRPIAGALHRRLPDADIFSTYRPEQPGIVFTPGVSLAIYLNKPVVRVENLANLRPPRDRP